MIDVEYLSRAYGDFLAVDSVSFHIKPGEIVGLLGHNGAGKTTIMKMLSGYLEPSAGKVRIDGKDLNGELQAVQERLGYLPENLPVYPDMGVADYLHYAATLKGLSGETLRDSVRRAVRDTELVDKLLDPIATLSRGYKQRVGVAQAILGAPKVLILDEPTNGLDPNQTRHMRDLIQALAENATVILSTHIMQEVDAICDRVLILRDGQLGLDETLAQLRTAASLKLKCSLEISQLQSLLPNMQFTTEGESLRVALDSAGDSERVAAEVAGAIAQAGGQLYLLAPEVKDLETVFRQASLAEGVTHAA